MFTKRRFNYVTSAHVCDTVLLVQLQISKFVRLLTFRKLPGFCASISMVPIPVPLSPASRGGNRDATRLVLFACHFLNNARSTPGCPNSASIFNLDSQCVAILRIVTFDVVPVLRVNHGCRFEPNVCHVLTTGKSIGGRD